MFKLSDPQISKLADIVSDIGTVALATVTFPALLDKFNPRALIGGLIFAVIFWILGVALVKNNYD
jgi:hypothetical protein